MIKYVHNSGHFWYEAGTPKVQCVMTSDEDLSDSIELTGEDVNGLNDEYVLANGCVIIEPSKNHVSLEDGVFTKKG